MRTAFAAIALLVLGTVAAIELPPPQAPAHIGQTDATVGFNTAVGGKAAGSEPEPEKCREHYEYSSVFKKCLPQKGFDGYVGQQHQQQQPQQQQQPSEVHGGGARLTQNPARSSIARLMGVAPIRIAPLQSRVSNQPLIAGQNRFITNPAAAGQQTGQSSCPAGFVMRKGLCVSPQQAIRRGRSNENESDDDDNNRNDDDDNNNNDDDSDEAELKREQRARRFRSRFHPFAMRPPFMGRAGMYGESAPRFMGFRPFGGVRPQITIPTIVIVLPPLPSGRAERNATARGERNETDTATPVAVAGPAASPAAVVAPRATAVADKVAAKLGKKIDKGIDKAADKVAAKVEEKVGGAGQTGEKKETGAADEKPAAAEETTPKKEESDNKDKDNDESNTSSSSEPSAPAPDQAKVTETPRESDLPNSDQSKPSDSESTSSSTAPSTSASSSDEQSNE